jgi:three-Cys-motif partner protein
MVLDDDDDEKWRYREHTAAKHEVYQKYLTPWTYKLASFNNRLRVVDCFAGRGEYIEAIDCEGVQLEEIDTPTDLPGSPQIILDRLTAHSDKFFEAECIFIEENDTNFEILEDNIQNTSGVARNVKKECVKGKFQEEVLDLVETDGTDCPTLFFIDPFGFKSLDYDVITEIGSTDQFELLITFMQRDINRFLENDLHQDAIENVFNQPNVPQKIEGYDADNWEELAEFYTDCLEQKGPEHTFEYLITEPDTRQTVYYLIFGSNHPNGLKTMREVMHTCGTGNFGYAPKHKEHTREQTDLGGFGAGSNLPKSFLLDNFSEHRIEFGNLVEKCSEIRKYDQAVESDYRQSIKELENEDKLTVIRRTSKSNGVQKGDLIDFRGEGPDELEE